MTEAVASKEYRLPSCSNRWVKDDLVRHTYEGQRGRMIPQEENSKYIRQKKDNMHSSAFEDYTSRHVGIILCGFTRKSIGV